MGGFDTSDFTPDKLDTSDFKPDDGPDYYANSPLFGTAKHMGTAIGANLMAGVRSVWDMAHNVPLSEIDKRNQKFISENTYNPAPGTPAAGTINLLGAPGKAADWSLGKVSDMANKAFDPGTYSTSGLPSTGGPTAVGPILTGAAQTAINAAGMRMLPGEGLPAKVGPAQALRDMRESIGPDVTSGDPVEHADTIIGAYKAKASAADADVAAKYKALEDANGGQFPVDAGVLLKHATDQLHQKLVFDSAPQSIMKPLQRLADDDNMTFENFESLRSNLATIQRTSTDGLEKKAAGIIRDAMENAPLPEDAAALKPLADSARAAARTQKQALENDPAYKAAVTDSVSPDKFVRRFIINGNRDDLATMRQNLADHPEAQQTIGVAALDHLRTSAGIDNFGSGTFSSRGFNSAWRNLSPKRDSLFDDPSAPQYLDQLGGVNFDKAPPSAAAEYAGKAAEGLANYAAHGIPVGTAAKTIYKRAFPAQPKVRPYEKPQPVSSE